MYAYIRVDDTNIGHLGYIQGRWRDGLGANSNWTLKDSRFGLLCWQGEANLCTGLNQGLLE